MCENLLKNVLLLEKKNYLENRFMTGKNSRSLWNDFRELGLIKTHERDHLLNLNIDEINDYYINCAGTSDINSGDLDFSNQLTSQLDSQFNFSRINSVSVKKSIMRITSSSVGPDGFSIKCYKIMLPFMLHLFTYLFNLSLSTCKFPELWKKSFVVSVPKQRDSEKFSDYRPISILCVLSKAFERCVYDQMLKYVVDNNFID